MTPGANPPPSLSVIVCAYTLERQRLLERAIRGLDAQVAPPDEVIIVIDHNDDLLQWARDRWPHHLVIPNGGGRGLSGARNTGIAASRGWIVAFLDDDAVSRPEWTTIIRGVFRDSPTVHAVGGTIHAEWPSDRRPLWFPPEFDWVVGCTYVGCPTVRAPVRNIIGASMAMRAESLASVGGFRSELGRRGSSPLGCEETDLCIRLRRSFGGESVIFDPTLLAAQCVPQSRTTVGYFVRRCFSEGVSKATLSGLVGSDDALSAERHYTMRVLPQGVGRELRRALRRGSPSAAARAAMIAVGLLVTALGYGGQYARERVTRHRADRTPEPPRVTA